MIPVLIMTGVMAVFFVGLLLLAHGPASPRFGVSRNGDDLVVVSAVCPGEQLTEVGLWRSGADEETGVTVWKMSGPIEHIDEFRIGMPIDGMTESRPLEVPLRADDQLELSVSTTELRSPDALRFSPSDVVEGEVFTEYETYDDRSDFAEARFDRTPCDDPDNTQRERRLARNLGLGLFGFLGVIVAAIAGIVRRQRKPRQWPPPVTARQ